MNCGPATAQTEDSYTGNFWVGLCSNENDPDKTVCLSYLRGMSDLNDFLEFGAKKPLWCLPAGVTVDQIRRVVVADANKYPERLHHPFAAVVLGALMEKFPCPRPK
jgi:hypothetical protein